MRFPRSLLVAAVLATGASILASTPAGAQDITVTTTADGGPGSLRAAVDTAADNGQDDVITLAAGAEYEVCSPLVHDDTGHTLRVVAPEPRPVIRAICGNQIFTNTGARLELAYLDLVDGGGGNGGAVSSTGTGNSLLIEYSKLYDNTATGRGGAVYGTASIEVEGSSILRNHAAVGGGGIGLLGTADLEIVESSIRDNTTDGQGGGIGVFGNATPSDQVAIERSDFWRNGAALDGGGIRVDGADLALDDSEVSQNTAGTLGGGISVTDGFPAIRVTTVSDNTADGGGGIYLNSDGLGVVLYTSVVNNTADLGAAIYSVGDGAALAGVVAGSMGLTPASLCTGSGFTTLGNNVATRLGCGFDHASDQQSVFDLKLRPLEFNGPHTRSYHPRTVDSPIYGVGAGSLCGVGAASTDQRGVVRPQEGACEAGSIEADPLAPPSHVFSDVPPWVEEAVRWVWFYQYSVGFADHTFRPNEPITRAQVIRQLWRVAGEPGPYPPHGLSDVPAWVEDAVRWGIAEGIVDGFADGTFRPDDSITRAQNVRMLHRTNGSPAGPPHGLSDVPPWIEDAVRWAANDPDGPGGPQLPVMTGYSDGTFRPTLDITRAASTRATHRAATNPLR